MAILMVFSIITVLIGVEKTQSWGKFHYLIEFVFIALSCVLYAYQLNGNTGFGNVFAEGFKTTAVVISFYILFLILELTVLFPSIKQKTLTIMQAELVNSGNGITPEQIEKSLAAAKEHFLVFAAAGTLLMMLVTGAFASLIGAYLAKKNPISPR